jgi:AbrB family looped-hinge helix DNA binding protein
MGSVITTRGRVTLPISVRRHLGVKTGGTVRFFIRPDGGVVLLPAPPEASEEGIVGAHPFSQEKP